MVTLEWRSRQRALLEWDYIFGTYCSNTIALLHKRDISAQACGMFFLVWAEFHVTEQLHSIDDGHTLEELRKISTSESR